MSVATQKRLAIAAAAIGVGFFAAANAHLFIVAFSSQPACAVHEAGPAPARKAC